MAHDDRDKNAALDASEYDRFYRRLVLLVDPDEDMTASEILEAMREDFKADAGDDDCVTKEEFTSSVFELADNWTSSLERDEYLEFLALGYAKVFGSLDKADALCFPDEWQPFLKSGRTLTGMTVNSATEFAIRVYEAHAATLEAGGGEQSIAALALSELKLQFGTRDDAQLKKRVKALTITLEAANRDETRNDLLWLFARVVGCFSPSGRVKAVPPAGVDFLVRYFTKMQTIVASCRTSLPSRLQSPTQSMLTNGKVGSKVGYVGLHPIKQHLPKELYGPLKLSANGRESKLRAAIERVIERLARPLVDLCTEAKIPNGADLAKDLKVRDLCTPVDLLLLVANVWCAVNWDVCENANKAMRSSLSQPSLH